jgi:hypothetical protein
VAVDAGTPCFGSSVAPVESLVSVLVRVARPASWHFRWRPVRTCCLVAPALPGVLAAVINAPEGATPSSRAVAAGVRRHEALCGS